ncbi:FAD-dependent monooxygenase [Streptomyces sp. SP18CS02]|uniref:FAD-dependent monooxygenase n=1 Tax=Streptomyces sp. SP18CS02 TaxID=3002531 RepID=UPI002E793523|nr:FAD-dependent monooxygenase [Streptomyces sp. SP18CS02]MEE1751690.1 FAD-dependent monooxygenase [Streptomyces sp. SP18CS02]
MDPVIIVGAGPVGLALALSLAAQGVPSVVLDESAGKEEPRPARTAVLRADMAAFVERLGCATVRYEGARWAGWRSMRRRQEARRVLFAEEPDTPGGRGDSDREPGPRPGPGPGIGHDSGSGFGFGLGFDRRPDHDFDDSGGFEPDGPEEPDGDRVPSPLHIPQHALAGGLRQAIATLPAGELVQVVPHSRLDAIEQDAHGVTAHTRGPEATWWRGSYLVGCDGARSTVRKLLGVRFPGRTAVERHAVATLRTELPWPGEGLLHRQPPWRGGDEITARPLPDDGWRLDWLLPPRGELVTPDALVSRIRETLAGWCGTTPAYDLVDTGVYTLHHRLARSWRVDRAFLAGDAAHLLGALGTQGLDEGLRDAENLAWKLAQAWHHGASVTLLDSYQTERRTAVAARLRAADQSLPVLRGAGGLRTYLRGGTRGYDTLLTDGHLGRGPLGAPPSYAHSPLMPEHVEAHASVGTPPGAPVADVRVTAPDGTSVRLRDRLGRGRLLVVLVAPGTGVWDRRHWMTAGVMPRLAAAVTAMPVEGELLVTEAYPGAAAHSVLLVRPDGHLAAAFEGVRPQELRAAADAVRGGAPSAVRSDETANIN